MKNGHLSVAAFLAVARNRQLQIAFCASPSSAFFKSACVG
jgi:hypothetical protein